MFAWFRRLIARKVTNTTREFNTALSRAYHYVAMHQRMLTMAVVKAYELDQKVVLSNPEPLYDNGLTVDITYDEGNLYYMVVTIKHRQQKFIVELLRAMLVDDAVNFAGILHREVENGYEIVVNGAAPGMVLSYLHQREDAARANA